MFFLKVVVLTILFTEVFLLELPKFKEKIIGGTEVNIYFSPYQASIHYEAGHVCGGAIISNLHVLTAAHCLQSRSLRKLTVNVGGSYHSAPLQKIPIYRYKIHQNYNPRTYDNDIAIFELVSRMVFGPNVLPVALPNQDEPLPEGSTGIVSGWGQTQESVKLLSGKLRMVVVPTISKELCQKLNAPKLITDNMICAADINGGKDSCQGDSGSGFVSKGKLYGITSWGIGCGRQNKAGVYTKVSKYRNWIRLYTGV